MRKLSLEIARDRDASKDGLRAFLIATGEAVFLFNDDVTKYVEGLRDRAEELQSLNCDHYVRFYRGGARRQNRTGNLPRPFYDRAKERLTQDEEERIRLSAAESL